MGILSTELQNVQNPALGAVLLWRFCVGYAEHNEFRSPPPLPMLFVVLPVLLHEQTAAIVNSTQGRSGLRAFAEKFGQTSRAQNDLLLAIQDRALTMRRLTLTSLRLALASQLVTISTNDGTVIALSRTTPRARFPQQIRPLLAGAEKLGTWCSNLSLFELSSIMKVGF